jgi:pyruvate dehydrogenase (quinone)
LHEAEGRVQTIVPDPGSLTRLGALLNEADRVTTLCGSGCEGAHYELVGLGERLYMVKAVLNC